jgi:hypothetical protein
MAPFILHRMGGFSNYGAKPSLTILSLHFMYSTPEMFSSVMRLALPLLALFEWADALTARAGLSW